MKSISLNFFGKQVTINVPTDLSSLRKTIADKFLFSPSDAAEIVLSYMKDLEKQFTKLNKILELSFPTKLVKLT